MNYISSFKPSFNGYQGLQAKDDLVQQRQASVKKESLMASETRNLDLNITTKEGDVVTLSKESFMDFSSFSYDKSGSISQGNEKAAINVSSRSMTLASGSSFSFSVQGDLNESELDDIESLISSLDEIMYEMSSGDIDEAFGMAQELDEFDSFSQYSADLNYSSAYSYEKQTASMSNRRYDEMASDSSDIRELADTANSSSRLLDRMLKEMEKLTEKEEIGPRKIQDPVEQLFNHHIKELTKNNEEDAPQNKMVSMFEQARKGMKENFNRLMQEMSPAPGSFRHHI